jgi:hypothetical protein
MSQRNLGRSAILLFLLGFIVWPFIFTGHGNRSVVGFLSLGLLGPGGLFLYAVIVIAVAAIRPVAEPIENCMARIRHATETHPVRFSLAAGVACTAILTFNAFAQHRSLYTAWHDEFSYLIQAHQFASGHLWMPRHPLGDFFDSFQLLIEPVYASAYFPGTAILYVPGIWLHVPAYFTALLISGTVAGLLFRIIVELLGGLAGWLAVLLLLSDVVFRQLSVITIAQMPLLMYSLAAMVAWLRWRKSGGAAAALLIGVFLGLAAITRPVDALCFGIPIGVAVLFHHRGGLPRASKARAVLLIIAAALPMLCFQLVLDRGITGHWLLTPFDLYAQRDYPDTSYGFHPFHPDARPVSVVRQKQILYDLYIPLIKLHRPSHVLADLFDWRLRRMLGQLSPVPYPLLALLCPLCLLALNKTRLTLLVTFPLLAVFYAAYVFFMPHYTMVFTPALILSILLGAEAVAKAAGKRGRFAELALTLFITGIAVASLPCFTVPDHDIFGTTVIRSFNRQLPSLRSRFAVVLFTFDPKRDLDEEPVYNADVAWPDDAPVIRAHDLGPRNHEIFEYYAARQPDRFFYRFDEATRTLIPLGTAKQLARPPVTSHIP